VLSSCLHLEAVRKCNTPVEPTTQTAAEHAVGGVRKHSDDELDIAPNELGITLPSTRVPCPLSPGWVRVLPSGASLPLPLGKASWDARAHMDGGLIVWGHCGWSKSVLPGHGQLWHFETHRTHVFRRARAGVGSGDRTDPPVRVTCPVFFMSVLRRRLDTSQPFLVAGGQQAVSKTSSAHTCVCTHTCERCFFAVKIEHLFLWQHFQSHGVFTQGLLSFNFIKQLLLLLPAFETAAPRADDLRISRFVAKH